MKQILVLIMGVPLAAAVATATSLPIMLAMGFLLLLALWAAPLQPAAKVRHAPEGRVAMNNNLHHWHDEHMVRYEMREIDRAVEQARLLREAGLSRTSWLTRVMNGLVNLLKARRKGAQDPRPTEPKASPRKSPRSA